MALVDLRAKQRGGSASGQTVEVEANERRELFIAQGLPPYAEMVRRGNGWTVSTATAFAPVAAAPTTTARLEVFNNTSDSVLIVDSLHAFQLLSTAVTQTYAIWACVSTKKAAPTNTALNIYSLSGRALVATTASGRIITAVDTTVVANGWRPWGDAQAWGTAAATPGNSWETRVDGRMLVPPSHSLLVVIVGSVATASSFQCGATYFEEELAYVA